MAHAEFPGRLIAGDALPYLNPEYVLSLMKTDKKLKKYFEKLIRERDLIGDQPYLRTSVHQSAPSFVDPEMSVFYRYFISKFNSNLQRRDARCGLLENYAAIFPFRVDSEVQIDSIEILELFEKDKFLTKIGPFKDHHIIDSDYNNLEVMLIRNIESFRRENFSTLFPVSYERLKAIAEIGSRGEEESEEPVGYLCDYLNHMYHLNENGVDWYMNLQAACNEVYNLYNKDLISNKGRAYFKYLPEINCCELLLLLEDQFYKHEHEEYTYLFKKYLFFFGHAVDFARLDHPVFFIDDALFTCLISLSRYQQFSEDTRNVVMIYELWMLTLVHFRLFTSSEPREPNLRIVCPENLRNVARYVALNLGRNSCVFYEDSLLCPLRYRNFYVRQDTSTLYSLMFVNIKRLELRHFYDAILKAALVERTINRIIIYNAYSGEEMMISMPRRVNDIRNLIVAMHFKEIHFLRSCRRDPLKLKTAVTLCDRLQFNLPKVEEVSDTETYLATALTEMRRECFFKPSDVEESVPFDEELLASVEAALCYSGSRDNCDRMPEADRHPNVCSKFQKSVSSDCILSLSPPIPSYNSRHSI